MLLVVKKSAWYYHRFLRKDKRGSLLVVLCGIKTRIVARSTDGCAQSGRQDRVIDAAFANGYESLSGFSAAVKKLTGENPQRFKHREAIQIC